MWHLVVPGSIAAPVLLLILSFCGFSGALATRLIDPLITSIAADFATSVGVVAVREFGTRDIRARYHPGRSLSPTKRIS